MASRDHSRWGGGCKKCKTIFYRQKLFSYINIFFINSILPTSSLKVPPTPPARYTPANECMQGFENIHVQ